MLTLRTDGPVAELGLYRDTTQLSYVTWSAHRTLAETLHTRLTDLLAGQHKALSDLAAVAVYRGPGSFTGLRIGIAVANTLAYALRVPIVSSGGDGWLHTAIKRLLAGENEAVVLPYYGAPPHITAQKK